MCVGRREAQECHVEFDSGIPDELAEVGLPGDTGCRDLETEEIAVEAK